MKNDITPHDFCRLKEAKLSILVDTGEVRVLRVRANPDLPYTGMFPWFDIVTWPNHLTIAGDYGTFTFSRLKDMFEFFSPTSISLSYALTKLTSSCTTSGSECYDSEGVLEAIKESIMDFNDLSKDDDNELTHALAEFLEELEGLLGGAMSVGEASRALDRVIDDYEGPLEMSEDLVSEMYWTTPTYQVLWCIWAIHWAIREYRRCTDPAWPAQEIQHLVRYFFPGASKLSDLEYTYDGGSLRTAPTGVTWARNGQTPELIQTPQELAARMVELGLTPPKYF